MSLRLVRRDAFKRFGLRAFVRPLFPVFKSCPSEVIRGHSAERDSVPSPLQGAV
jgi:hypothetical protein